MCGCVLGLGWFVDVACLMFCMCVMCVVCVVVCCIVCCLQGASLV